MTLGSRTSKPFLVPEESIPFKGDNSVIPDRTCALVIQAKNGVFAFGRLLVANMIFLEVVQQIRSSPPPWQSDLREFQRETRLGFDKASAQKIGRVTSFFRWVYSTYDDSEAIVFIYFSPQNGGTWEFVPPPQKVYVSKLEWEDPGATPEGWVLLGSIHSHGSGAAGHSRTDDEDELPDWNGIHITFGRFGNSNLQLDVSVSVVINGSRFYLDLSDLVEQGPEITFPNDWKNEVKYVKDLR